MNQPVQIIEGSTPELETAKARLAELEKVFQFNEVLGMLDGLIGEVVEKPLAARFSRERKVYEAWAGSPKSMSLVLANMTEAEFKREQLKRDLRSIRQAVFSLGGDFEAVFMDMVASQTDYS